MRSDVRGPVLIVGTGLLGTSLGLALREHDVEVGLENRSPSSLHLARDLGAGVPAPAGFRPALVVVATPPDVIVPHVVAALRAYPDAVVTDVASVKGGLASEVASEAGGRVARYVGSHPMAGRERSGAAAADSDLFQGRTWVICPHGAAASDAVAAVRRLAITVGSLPVVMDPRDHDAAVAAVSHLPQLVASLTATRLADLPGEALALAGQGVRDVTRIAASDPMMWSAIFAANAAAVLPHARALLGSLSEVVNALEAAASEGPGAAGVMKAFAGVVEAGRRGVARIPGKHGGVARRYAEVTVFVPDKPGELGRLFAEIGDAGINIEDLRLEHAAGAKLGVATLSVLPARAGELSAHLEELGWRVMA